MTPEERITRDVANVVCKRITGKTRLAMMRMTDCRLSGDDTPLKNIWEEICVQRQSEDSYAWSVYEETLRAFIEGCLTELPRYEIEAVWLQTDNAIDILDEEKESQRAPNERTPIYEPAVVDHLFDLVLNDAVNWSNKRIRAYLDRPTD